MNRFFMHANFDDHQDLHIIENFFGKVEKYIFHGIWKKVTENVARKVKNIYNYSFL